MIFRVILCVYNIDQSINQSINQVFVYLMCDTIVLNIRDDEMMIVDPSPWSGYDVNAWGKLLAHSRLCCQPLFVVFRILFLLDLTKIIQNNQLTVGHNFSCC